MKSKKYSILVSSVTGNTKALADAIYEVLPKEYCDFYGNAKAQVPQSEILYIGFWTDKGTADSDTLKLLQALKNKKFFVWHSRIRRQRSIFPKNTESNQAIIRLKQCRCGRIYVPRQNAAIRKRTLC